MRGGSHTLGTMAETDGGANNLGVRPAKVDEILRLLDSLNRDEVAKAWALSMREMHKRELIRSANVVGDYAEAVACRLLELTPVGNRSEKGYDATGPAGRYQIKGRRVTPWNRSREVGAIRDIHLDPPPFDVLVVVLFDEDLNLTGLFSIPPEVVREAKVVGRTNATKFVLSKAHEIDPRIITHPTSHP